MSKKNLYAFSALLTLSCSVYAMERDDLSSSLGSVFRSSSASGDIPGEKPDKTGAQEFFPTAVLGEPVDEAFAPFPSKFDFSALESSTQSLSFPDDNAEVTVTLLAQRDATKITELEAELEAFKAQIAVQQEIERQLTSRLAALKAEFEASKAEARELRTSLKTERAESKRLRDALNDIKVELLDSGIYYSSTKIQEALQ